MIQQLTLKDILDFLKIAPPKAVVHFDFCHFSPGRLHSYRGHYDQLALEYQQSRTVYVGELYSDALSAFGKSFQGYKGGNYVMGALTPLWVDNWGDCTNTMLCGIRQEGEYLVVLETGRGEL